MLVRTCKQAAIADLKLRKSHESFYVHYYHNAIHYNNNIHDLI